MSLIPQEIISKYALSQDSLFFLKADFLVHFPLLIQFYQDERLFEPLTYMDETYLILGDDYGTKISLKAGIEDIWSIDPTKQLPARFINKNIKCFLEFLNIYYSHQEEIKAASDMEVTNIVRKIQSEFNKTDTHSLNNLDNWWSIILEQAEDGLL